MVFLSKKDGPIRTMKGTERFRRFLVLMDIEERKIWLLLIHDLRFSFMDRFVDVLLLFFYKVEVVI